MQNVQKVSVEEKIQNADLNQPPKDQKDPNDIESKNKVESAVVVAEGKVLKEESADVVKDEDGNVYNLKLSYTFAFLTAITFGIANVLMADIGGQFGIKALYLQATPLFLTWLVFHIF